MKWAAIIVAALVGFGIGRFSRQTPPAAPPVYVFNTIRDTVTVVRPVPVVVPETIRVEKERLVSVTGDSVEALVPITSVRYSGEGYSATVSGFRPRLDSLVFERSVTDVRCAPPPKRWSVGVQAGVALTPGGIQPFIGVGVSYRLFEL